MKDINQCYFSVRSWILVNINIWEFYKSKMANGCHELRSLTCGNFPHYFSHRFAAPFRILPYTFRTSAFYKPPKVPKFPAAKGTFVPWNFRSRDRKFLETKRPGTKCLKSSQVSRSGVPPLSCPPYMPDEHIQV